MASPGGKSVGRLSVRVVPDTSKLRTDLKKALDRIESTTEINLRVLADTDKARESVRKLVNDVNDQGATINVDADTGRVRQRLAVLTRARKVSLLPEVSQAAATKAATTIAALSGARLLSDKLSGIGTALANLDRSLPRIGAISLGIANLGSVALGSLAGLSGLATSLVSIAGAAFVLPGLFGGLALGVGVMAVALADAKTQLAPITDRFTKLRAVISGEYWDQARGPLLDLARTVFPELKAGATGIASALGGWTAALTNAIGEAFGGERLAGMFADLAASITVASTGTGSFASMLATLGTVGSSYLPKLAQAFATLLSNVDAFLLTVAGDGRLQQWIDTGVAAAGQLAGVLANLGQILVAVAEAAATAGAGGLSGLNAALGSIAQIVASPAFQGTLVTLFEGAAAGAALLADALGPIGDMLATLAPTLSSVMQTAGSAVAGFAATLAGVLSRPEVATGLQSMFDGLAAGLAGLTPAIGPVGQALGALGETIGVLASTFGPLIGQTLAVLAPILAEILTAAQPLIQALGTALSQAIATAAPWLSTLATTLLPPLSDALVAIVKSLGPLFEALAPLTPVFTTIAQNVAALLPVIAELVTQAISQLVQLLPPIVDAMSAWATATAPLIPAIADLVTAMIPLAGQLIPVIAAILPDLVDIFIQVTDAIAPNAEAFAQLTGALADTAVALAPLVADLLPPLTELLKLVIAPTIGLATGILSQLVPAMVRGSEMVTSLADGVSAFADRLTQMRDQVQEKSQQVAGFFSGLKDSVQGVFSDVGSWLADAGGKMIEGLAKGIADAAQRPIDAAKAVLTKIGDLFPHSPAKTGPFSGRGWTLYSGRAIASSMAQGMADNEDQVRAAALSLATAAVPAAATTAKAQEQALASGRALSAGGGITVQMNGPMYSYDPTELARAVVTRARDAIAAQGIAELARG